MMIGQKLAHYEIVSALGTGGMGEVWRAHDTKLGREVAIKTLPEEFAEDAERLARFEREARFLATLDHPNIAGIHGLEESHGVRFLVLELVEGDTVAELLEKGPFAVDDALGLGLQIAQALEAAHEKGVIHRDLKPANVKTTRDSRVKVLDFGLAKAFVVDEAEVANDSKLSNSPLHSLTATARGVLLGTAPYMAPEQARGEPVQLRSDIWAFACVLFEMLTGQRPFEGRTVSDILASILKTEPDWSLLPDDVPLRVRFLLERCLEKDPRLRPGRIAEVRAELEQSLAEPGAAGSEKTGVRRASAASWLGWAAAIAVAAAGSALAAGWFRPPEPLPEMRFGFALPDAMQRFAAPVSVLAYSPDGQRLAYSSLDRLWIRRIHEIEPVPVSGPSGWIALPVFDPESRLLAYVSGRTSAGPFSIMRVAVEGGGRTPQPVHTGLAALPTDLAWDETGMLLYVQPDGIWEVPAAGGGTPGRVIAAREGEELASPQRLPDGESVLFAATSAEGAGRWDSGGIFVARSGSTEWTLVLEGASDPRYIASGHLIFAEGTTLWGIGFAPDTGRVFGDRFRVVDSDILRAPDGESDTAQYAVSASGAIAYLGEAPELPDFARGAGRAVPYPEMMASTGSLVWYDPATEDVETIEIPVEEYTSARISPDGSRAVLVIGESANGSPDLWMLDLTTTDMSRITYDGLSDAPVWLDNDRVLFRRGPQPYGVYSMPADGLAEGDEPERLYVSDNPLTVPYPWALTRDGQSLVLMTVNIATLGAQDLMTLPLDGNGELLPLLTTELTENAAAISPNADYIAHQEGQGIGSNTVIQIRPFPDVGRTSWRVGTGTWPVFSRDGSRLYFVDGDDIAFVPIEYEPFDIGPRTYLGLQGQYIFSNGAGRAWDFAEDGRLLLVLRGGPTVANDLQINVTVGLAEVLAERAR